MAACCGVCGGVIVHDCEAICLRTNGTRTARAVVRTAGTGRSGIGRSRAVLEAATSTRTPHHRRSVNSRAAADV